MTESFPHIAGLLAKQGRFGDKHLLHINDAELEALRSHGLLHTNPVTGLPEAWRPFHGDFRLHKGSITPKRALSAFANPLIAQGTALARGLGHSKLADKGDTANIYGSGIAGLIAGGAALGAGGAGAGAGAGGVSGAATAGTLGAGGAGGLAGGAGGGGMGLGNMIGGGLGIFGALLGANQARHNEDFFRGEGDPYRSQLRAMTADPNIYFQGPVAQELARQADTRYSANFGNPAGSGTAQALTLQALLAGYGQERDRLARMGGLEQINQGMVPAAGAKGQAYGNVFGSLQQMLGSMGGGFGGFGGGGGGGGTAGFGGLSGID